MGEMRSNSLTYSDHSAGTSFCFQTMARDLAANGTLLPVSMVFAATWIFQSRKLGGGMIERL